MVTGDGVIVIGSLEGGGKEPTWPVVEIEPGELSGCEPNSRGASALTEGEQVGTPYHHNDAAHPTTSTNTSSCCCRTTPLRAQPTPTAWLLFARR
jgi:hypothetical protein